MSESPRPQGVGEPCLSPCAALVAAVGAWVEAAADYQARTFESPESPEHAERVGRLVERLVDAECAVARAHRRCVRSRAGRSGAKHSTKLSVAQDGDKPAEKPRG